VDQPVKHVAAADFRGRRAARHRRLTGRSGKPERAMRALGVVMGQIAPKHLLKMPAAEDEDVVEALGSVVRGFLCI
jgi:hypothetical protein